MFCACRFCALVFACRFCGIFFLHFPPPTLPVCTHCHLRLYRITTCILCTCCVLNCVIVYLLCSHCVLNGVLIVYSMCTLSFNIIPYYYTYIVYSIVLLCTHCVRVVLIVCLIVCIGCGTNYVLYVLSVPNATRETPPLAHPLTA